MHPVVTPIGPKPMHSQRIDAAEIESAWLTAC
jgi:hypothetical protein